MESDFQTATKEARRQLNDISNVREKSNYQSRKKKNKTFQINKTDTCQQQGDIIQTRIKLSQMENVQYARRPEQIK